MKTIKKLALSNNKENKTRSILTMIAIALTTMMITAIGTFGYGGLKGNIDNAEKLHGSYIAAFANIDEEQFHKMSKRGEINDIGIVASVGESNTKGYSKVAWADKKALMMTKGYYALKEGNSPEKYNEIVASRVFFKQLGYKNIKLGDKVTVPIRKNGNEGFKNYEFVISGILQDGIGNEKQQSSTVLVSKEYYDSKFPKGQKQFTAYFNLDENIKGNSDDIELLIEELATKCNVVKDNVIENRSLIITKYAPTSEVLIPCVLMCLVVVIFAAVVIYNIFQIGISRKIQEYGKIKAIGATKKQMKKIIITEGMLLAVIAIPIGLFIGYFVTEILFNRIMDFARSGGAVIAVEDISLFSPVIIIVSALVSFITVRISLIKSIKTVTSIAPVDAFSYEESISNKKGYKKGHKALNIWGLIKSDLLTNKKRNIMTIIVMGVSCILFVVISSLTSSINPEYDARLNVEYGDYQLEINYDNYDNVYKENNLDKIFVNNPISDIRIKEFENIDGVEKIKTRKYLTFKDKEGIKTVAIFDRESFDKELKNPGKVGDFTYDSVSKANGFVYPFSHFMEEYGEKIGDKIDVELRSDKSSVKYKGTAMGAFGSVSADYIITEDTAKKLGLDDSSYAYIWIYCNDSAKSAVESKINELYENDEHVYWESYDEVYQLAEKQMIVMKLISYAFLGLIGTICFLNMANTMIMNVITRKREFGILQAVGMSNKQLGKMLQFEGILFTLGSIATSLIIGLPAGYGLFLFAKAKGIFGIKVYNFPTAEVLIMILALLIMQVILSFVLSKNVKQESIIDRIRY